MEVSSVQEGTRPVRRSIRVALSLLLCAAALAAKLWYPQAAGALEAWITGGEDGCVAEAFAAFRDSMALGDPVHQAVEAFCAEMTDNGIS